MGNCQLRVAEQQRGYLIRADLLGNIVSKLMSGFMHEGFVVKVLEFGHGGQAGKMLVK